MSDSNVLDEHDEMPEMLRPSQSLAIGIARAEIDQQITTAKAYPRSIKQVTDRIYSLATLDEESAAESMYALPRGSGAEAKAITGPSIRFAEIVKQAYGNCRAAARVVHVDRTEMYVEAEGVFHDLETNVATTARVRRRISTSKGKCFSDDMIIVTGNAACAIGLRNAIMGGVPKPLWRKAFEAVQSTIKGDLTTLTAKRGEAIKAFANFGVKPEAVFAALGLAGAEDVTVEHIPILRGMFAALKNGEATVEEMFPAPAAPSTAPQAMNRQGEDNIPRGAKKPPAAKAKPPAQQEAPAAQEQDQAGEETQAGANGAADASPGADAAAALGGDDLPEGLKGAGEAKSEIRQPEPEKSTGAAEVNNGPKGEDAQPQDVIAEGIPQANEVYHLDGDAWTWSETRSEDRRDTYKNGEPFSDAGRDKGYPIYADHAPAAEEAKEPAAEVAAEPEDEFPPEFTTFIDAVEASKTWTEIKTAMAAFYNTDYFKALPSEQQNVIRGNTWDTATDAKVEGLPDQAVDASAFRLWIETQSDPEAISGTLAVLERQPAFEAKEPGFKDAIRRAVASRIEHVT